MDDGATFQPYDGPLSYRPRNLAEVNKLFGDPTRGGLYLKVADPKWENDKLVELHGPKEALHPALADYYWKCHRLVEPYMREAFRRAEEACPGYISKKGTWCYNFRRIRHDTPEKAKKAGRALYPLSFHSWGIALDINPDDNKAMTIPGGVRRFGEAWTKYYPEGIPQVIVQAFASCGFAWGGWWNGYCDPMHFEWKGQSKVQV